MDFNLRCFTFSLCSQVLITFLILFSEVLIFLVGDNEGKDKTYDYYRTEKSYVKLYVYIQIEFKCITVTLYIFVVVFSFCFFFLAESKIDTFIRYIIFGIGKGFSL